LPLLKNDIKELKEGESEMARERERERERERVVRGMAGE
jgi:hypothetical protein